MKYYILLNVRLGCLSVVMGDLWPIRVASGASNLPMEHFERRELEQENVWESVIMGAS